ncbi:unnamed protein product [marine sediment metagenome]|uniref:Uncharacterized protein n=1 Tax=marine sediment metagenome TaxID=412755 RepID=X0TZV8_9ZZZZ
MDKKDLDMVIKLKRSSYTDTNILNRLMGTVKLTNWELWLELKQNVKVFKNSIVNDIEPELLTDRILGEYSIFEEAFTFTIPTRALGYYRIFRDSGGVSLDIDHEKYNSKSDFIQDLIQDLESKGIDLNSEEWNTSRPFSTIYYYSIKDHAPFGEEAIIEHAELTDFFVAEIAENGELEGMLNPIIFTENASYDDEFKNHWIPLFFSFYPALYSRYQKLNFDEFEV